MLQAQLMRHEGWAFFSLVGGVGLTAYLHGVAGIRNSVGFDWDANGTLYFTNNGVDQLGNDQPDDALNAAPKPGLFYGFPYCHV